MEYAGFWRRAAAMSLDGVLLGVIQAVVNILLIAMIGATSVAGGEPGDAAAVGTVGIVSLLSFIATWLYFALMESSGKQATLGKMMVGIVVSDLAGDRISFGKASGRYLGKIVSAILLMIGYLMAAFTKRKQALHDIMAGCLVIRKPKSA